MNVININLIGSKLLNVNLFKDNFDFSTIGIGGLSDKIAIIYALSSRAIKA